MEQSRTSSQKRILIYYYSGTGHTRYLVERARSLLVSYGHRVDVADFTDLSDRAWHEYLPQEYDLLGIFYPVHAFLCPKNVISFVRKLDVREVPYFIVKDSREAMSLNDASSLPIVRAMKKKGCTFLSEKHLLLPYNIHFRHDDRLVKQMLLAIERKLPVYLQGVLNGETKPLRCRPSARVTGYVVGPIEQWGAKLIGNSFRPTENCIHCRRCVDACPQHTISWDEEKRSPVFDGGRCMICMRCVMNCPTNAITITRYLKGWEVNGRYDFAKILSSDEITPDFITPAYRGPMAKSYIRYFFSQN